MKKYLITGLAAVAISGMFTSCTHETDAGAGGTNLGVVETYEQAFISRFGTPSPDADWGFGNGATKAGTRVGNMDGKTPVAQTSTGINANANEWADKADAPHGHGGWLVPDPLTEPQKELVRKYFQTHPNLKYEDPHFANFFVQQVYKGDSIVKHEDTTEGIIAANGTPYASGTMNLLTVGKAPQQHINNFNRGTGSTVSVLDRGYTANDFNAHNHPDEIMLMVNIDDTQCMGYHETGSSTHHDDKAALVSWETIRKWARDEKIYTEDILNDGWNRSFVGFDLSLLPKEDVVTNTYATLKNNVPGNLPEYAWDGTNIMKIGTAPAGSGKEDQDLTSMLATNVYKQNGKALEADDKGVWTWDGQNFDFNLNVDATGYTKLVIEYDTPTPNNYNLSAWVEGGYLNNYDQNRKRGETKVEMELNNVTTIKTLYFQNGNGTFKIKRIYLTAGDNDIYYESPYILAGTEQIPFYIANTNQYGGTTIKVPETGENGIKIEVNGKTCLNLKRIKELYDLGYRPYSDRLADWVKWEGGDGYFSDWIVTLTEAKRADDNDDDDDDDDDNPSIRVIAEDMGDQSLKEASDFDFNDVVFDVTWVSESKVKIKILAAGGTLPLTVGWDGTEDPNDPKAYIKHEVHYMLGYSESTMINTHSTVGNYKDGVPPYEFEFTGSFKKESFAADVRDIIPVKVRKNGVWYDIKADQGKVAGKLAVDKEYEPWCNERKDIDDWWQNADKQGLFSKYTQDPTTLTKYWYKQAKYRQLKPGEYIELK